LATVLESASGNPRDDTSFCDLVARPGPTAAGAAGATTKQVPGMH
jgi:hypothetical protein